MQHNILKYKTMSEDDYRTIGEGFVEAVKKHNATVQTCFEERDLTEFGFIKAPDFVSYFPLTFPYTVILLSSV